MDINHHSDTAFEEIYQTAKEQLAPFGERSQIVREPSPEAAAQFRDEQFDFVFIDAQHQYSEAKKDLEGWWPKVRREASWPGTTTSTARWTNVILA